MAGVMIGIDPHKGSHTAMALDADEKKLGQLRVNHKPYDRPTGSAPAATTKHHPPCLLMTQRGLDLGSHRDAEPTMTRAQMSNRGCHVHTRPVAVWGLALSGLALRGRPDGALVGATRGIVPGHSIRRCGAVRDVCPRARGRHRLHLRS